MVFSDTATKQGLIQDCEQLIFGNYADISGNTNRLNDFTARINRAYDKVATLLMSSDGRWQWDDSNYTDLPVGSTSLVSTQQNYTMDVEFLDVLKVIVLDQAGNKTILNSFDINDPVARQFLMDISTTGGRPVYYDKTGNSFKLYPIPNYTKASGLIVHFRRKPSYFISTDTTKTAGIPITYHRYLSLEASLDYAISKQLTVKNDLAARVKEMTDSLVDFYSKRSKDESKFIRPVTRSAR